MACNLHLLGLLALKSMPHDWIQSVSEVLDDGPQLMFKIYFREVAKILEQKGKAKGIETYQDQILGEGTSADLEVQVF